MNYKKNKLTIKNHNYDNDVFQKLFEELEENLQYINEENFYHPSNSDRDIIDKFEVSNSFINFYEFKIDSVTLKRNYRQSSRDLFNIVLEFSRPQMNINDFSEIIKLTENIDHSFKCLKFDYEFENDEKNIRLIYNHEKEVYDIHYSSHKILKVVDRKLTEDMFNDIFESVRDKYSTNDKSLYDYCDTLYQINRDTSSVTNDLMNRLDNFELSQNIRLNDAKIVASLVECNSALIENIIINEIESYLIKKTVFRYASCFLTYLMILKTSNKRIKYIE